MKTFPPLRKIHLADLFPSWAFFFSAFTFPDRASITRRLLSLQVVANADPSQFQLSERGMSVWHEISLITKKMLDFLTGYFWYFYLRQNRLSRWKPYCQHLQRRVYYGQLDAMRPKELFFHGEIISQPKIIQSESCHRTNPSYVTRRLFTSLRRGSSKPPSLIIQIFTVQSSEADAIILSLKGHLKHHKTSYDSV